MPTQYGNSNTKNNQKDTQVSHSILHPRFFLRQLGHLFLRFFAPATG